NAGSVSLTVVDPSCRPTVNVVRLPFRTSKVDDVTEPEALNVARPTPAALLRAVTLEPVKSPNSPAVRLPITFREPIERASTLVDVHRPAVMALRAPRTALMVEAFAVRLTVMDVTSPSWKIRDELPRSPAMLRLLRATPATLPVAIRVELAKLPARPRVELPVVLTVPNEPAVKTLEVTSAAVSVVTAPVALITLTTTGPRVSEVTAPSRPPLWMFA